MANYPGGVECPSFVHELNLRLLRASRGLFLGTWALKPCFLVTDPRPETQKLNPTLQRLPPLTLSFELLKHPKV